MDQLPMMDVADSATIEGEVLSRQADPGAAATGGITAFTFGEPEGVMDRRDFLSYCELYHNNRWYEPPISRTGLAKAFDVSPHHSSSILLKVNLLLARFVPSRWLSADEFEKWALDFLTFGDGFLERRDNLAGRPMILQHSLARYTKRGIEAGDYWFVQGWKQEYQFRKDTVFQLRQPDVSQEIYGKPQYISALQSGLLNEAATLFRRRYYANGSHAGFVFYLNEETMSNKDVDAIRTSLKEARGVGNFKNLFIHAPKGKKDGVQIIPIAEVAAKDEFLGIKNTSRDDMLAAHRTPPQMLGVVPQNSGGFGDVSKATDVFVRNEILPLERRFLTLNDWLGLKAVAFEPYVPLSPQAAAD
ncbi:MAG: phage portal protein family [Novosphingobium sp.]|nr:phage portal protein family [Novosphingobium sp.]